MEIDVSVVMLLAWLVITSMAGISFLALLVEGSYVMICVTCITSVLLVTSIVMALALNIL